MQLRGFSGSLHLGVGVIEQQQNNGLFEIPSSLCIHQNEASVLPGAEAT